MDRWREIESVFAETLQREPAEREAFLRERCGEDFELYQEVAALVATHREDASAAPWAAAAALQIMRGAPRLQSGHRLGPYRIDAFVAAGGMGEVYKAFDTRLRRRVAVKRLTDHVDRFQQEARAIAALNHPHICQIYDVGSDYLVLEYVEGTPLCGPLSPDRALTLALQIAGALEVAHARGVLHRDLKPANILVTATGDAKLLDFGLAKLASRDTDLTRTNIGTVLGTAAYMSPEQARGLPVDERSDMFSFGAVLYELIAGHRAFEGTTSAEVISAVLRDEPPRLHADEAVDRLVRRCLEKAPERRFQTTGELVGALRAVIGSRASSASLDRTASIAVLPFADMSAEKDQEWFGDGLAEEIINALARIRPLKVTARTSAFAFRGKNQDVRSIAKALDVEHVLEGSVRRAGNRLRVTAQLIKATDGYHLWSQRYDRDMADVFAIQDEIAGSIADALRVTLGTGQKARQNTTSVPAYEAYLKARQYQWKMSPDVSMRAKQYYEQALAADPAFAMCYVGLAHHFMVLAAFSVMTSQEAVPQIRQAAQKALEIDPSLPEALAMLGIVAGIYEYEWKEAEQLFALAMRQEPVPADVQMWYGVFYLVPHARSVEAIGCFRLALRDDPLNPTYLGALAQGFAAHGQWDECERVARDVLEFDSSLIWQHHQIAESYAGRGRMSEALVALNRFYELLNVLESARFPLILNVEDGARLVPSLVRDAAPYIVFHAHWLMLHGASEAAAECMKHAIKQRHSLAPRLLGYDCWKTNPDYAELRRMMNLA